MAGSSETFMMSLEVQAVMIFHLTLAMILSVVVGLNRERNEKPAGLRTHMLTGVGACLFTLLSIHAFPGADSSRVAANIVTGIGFLGGGIIIQRKHSTYDLTTAVGIWATAAIGMAVGTGAWFLAIYATVMVWIILDVFRKIKNNIYKRMEQAEQKEQEKQPEPQQHHHPRAPEIGASVPLMLKKQ